MSSDSSTHRIPPLVAAVLALVVLGMVVSFLVIITILSMVLIMFGVAPPVEKG